MVDLFGERGEANVAPDSYFDTTLACKPLPRHSSVPRQASLYKGSHVSIKPLGHIVWQLRFVEDELMPVSF